MPATTNKQQFFNTIYTVLKKKFGARSSQNETQRPVLEEVIYAILRENATREEADQAYASLSKSFLDWNEVRVSTVQEVAESLKPLENAGQRARRIIGLLQKVFEEEYSFSLDDLGKKGLKQAAKQLSRYKDEVNDFVVAWVVQRALAGHSIPLDEQTLRVLTRLGVIRPGETDDAENLDALRTSIEHYIPKTRGSELTDFLAWLARDFCVAGVPHCSHCPLVSDCPTGTERLSKKLDKEKEQTKSKAKELEKSTGKDKEKKQKKPR